MSFPLLPAPHVPNVAVFAASLKVIAIVSVLWMCRPSTHLLRGR
jgi:hypothetical protein